MLAFIQQIVSGIATGGIYASLALGLVLIYRAMDVANFAQGEMATFSTFISYSLIEYAHFDFWSAFVVTILVSFGLGVAIERLLIRRFEGAPVLTLLIVTHEARVSHAATRVLVLRDGRLHLDVAEARSMETE